MKSDIEQAVKRMMQEGISLHSIAKRIGVKDDTIKRIKDGVWMPQYYPPLRKTWEMLHKRNMKVVSLSNMIPIEQIPVDNHGLYEDPVLAIDEDNQIRLACWDDDCGVWVSCDGVPNKIVFGIEVMKHEAGKYEGMFIYGQRDDVV